MPVGVMVNAMSVFLGGIIGALLGNKIPERLRNTLPLILGVASMSMGVVSMTKMKVLPAVILAVILGTTIGELVKFEKGIEWGVARACTLIEKMLPDNNDIENQKEIMEKIIGVLILFCASGTGVFGALQSGMTGDHTILLTKSILDLFSAIIFAASLGYIVSVIFIPQFVVLIALFLGATAIMPMTTPEMLADFNATGGILMLATGLRISDIKSFPIANMLPAMVIIMPISYLWTKYLI